MRDLRVWLDSDLMMKHHISISKTTSICFCHLWMAAPRQGQPGHHEAASDVARTESHRLLFALVCLRRPLLYSSATCRMPLHVLSCDWTVGHTVHTALHELHWLPVKYPVQNCGVHSPSHHSTMSSYVADLVAFWTLSDDLCAQRQLVQPSSNEHETDFGRRAFAVCGPDFWKSPTVATHRDFAFCIRTALKTHFYNIAFFLDFIVTSCLLTK